MAEHGYAHELGPDLRTRAAASIERDRLVLDLENRTARLNEQARIFIPLIALCLIVAIPIWSKSLSRFLMLLLSPFVLLPLGFSLIHLAVAWAGIARARSRIRVWERATEESKKSH